MTLLERENAIRKLLDKMEASGIDDGYCCLAYETWFPAYYGGIDSIGIVLRDVVPRLSAYEKWVMSSNGRIYRDRDRQILVEFTDLASMPAACCDELLRKEGLLP